MAINALQSSASALSALTMGLAGIPFFTHDIAGFSGGPGTKELFLRWTEMGAFTPFMRTHDGLKKFENHIFNSDEETLAFFKKFALIHKELPQIVEGIIARKKFVYLCTNAILLKARLGDYKPSPYLTFSIHLDGDQATHDESVCRAHRHDRWPIRAKGVCKV